MKCIELKNVIFDETTWIQKDLIKDFEGRHSINFVISGRDARKMKRWLSKLGEKRHVELYNENYRNLSMKKKIEFKNLQNWIFKYKPEDISLK